MIGLLSWFACVSSTDAQPEPKESAASPKHTSPTPNGIPGPRTQTLSFRCTDAALAATHPDTLRIYRNEVYARRGRPFKAKDLQKIFGKALWYKPDDGYTDARLTPDDTACIERIVRLSKSSAAHESPVRSPDLDGDGKGDTIGWDGVTLTVNGVSKKLIDKRADEFGPHGVDVIDLNPNDLKRELLIVTDPGVTDEFQFTVVRFENKTLDVLLPAPEWLDTTDYAVQPGRLVHTSKNCGQTVTTTFTLENDVLEKTQSKTGDFTESQCAACPYVVRLGEHATMLGEILASQSSEEEEREDTVDVGPLEPGIIRFKLIELKPETTYLNRLVLRIGEREILPENCGNHCTDNDRYTVIEAGADLEVSFQVPVRGHGELAAAGFYIPYRSEGTQELHRVASKLEAPNR